MPTLFIGGLGEPVYSACYLAVSVDLGTLYQPERGWGMQSHVASQEKRLTRKSPHFLTEFPGWSINRRREKD